MRSLLLALCLSVAVGMDAFAGEPAQSPVFPMTTLSGSIELDKERGRFLYTILRFKDGSRVLSPLAVQIGPEAAGPVILYGTPSKQMAFRVGLDEHSALAAPAGHVVILDVSANKVLITDATWTPETAWMALARRLVHEYRGNHSTTESQPLEARRFIITEDPITDEEGWFRRKEFVENIKELLEHLLYTAEGREEAIISGRRIFAGRVPDYLREKEDWDYDGTLTVVDTHENLERVREFLKLEPDKPEAPAGDITAATKPLIPVVKICAHCFRVAYIEYDDEPSKFRCRENVTYTQEILEHMLYTQEGREEAITNGRRIFVGLVPDMNTPSEDWDYDGTLTVVDKPDNLERVAAYFRSLSGHEESTESQNSEKTSGQTPLDQFQARRFTVTDDQDKSPEGMFRRENLVKSMIDILEHTLYSQFSRETAQFIGRHITAGRVPEPHVDEKDWDYDGTITVVDSPENIRRVEEYFASIEAAQK